MQTRSSQSCCAPGAESLLALALQAQRYAALRKPYLINDMIMQDVLLDRRRVYTSLKVGALPASDVFITRTSSWPDVHVGMAGL